MSRYLFVASLFVVCSACGKDTSSTHDQGHDTPDMTLDMGAEADLGSAAVDMTADFGPDGHMASDAGIACVLERTCRVDERDIAGYTLAMLDLPHNPRPRGAPDDDCDGVPESDCEIAVFAPNGIRTVFGHDADCDGVAETECGTYDPMVGERRDDDCDGNLDRCTAVVSSASTRVEGEDQDCDGLPDLNCESSTDLGGGVLQYFDDTDCDGAPEPPCWLSGANWRQDADCDGVADGGCELETTHSDGALVVTTTSEDQNCDGVPDRRCVVRAEDPSSHAGYGYMDANCDGGRDTDCWVSEDDGAGHVTHKSSPACNNVWERCRSEEFDAHGQLVAFTEDSNCDGQPERCQTWTRQGATQIGLTDRDCDGVQDVCTVFVTGGSGPPSSDLCEGYRSCWVWTRTNDVGTKIAESWTCDGQTECMEWTYSDDNRLLSARRAFVWEGRESLDCGPEYDYWRFSYSDDEGTMIRSDFESARCKAEP